MNALFSIVFLLAAIILLISSPETFLPTLIDGASKSAALCFSLIATYAVWLGLMNVWKDSGVTRAVSRIFRPLARKLFKTDDPETLDSVCMNASVNLLGISGAATAYGIKAANLLDQSENAEYSSSMLFVLNATSLQLLPTSIIGVRTALGSASPTDIILPTLIATLFSTLLGVALVRLLIPQGRKKTLSVHWETKKRKGQVFDE
ncbi:MAG: hypothetical protein J6B56_00900 [Clostridia bacterium]|nr:hypothetical protein [Clostridia bacterium]